MGFNESNTRQGDFVFKKPITTRYFETEMGEIQKREMDKTIKDAKINSNIAKMNSPTFRKTDPILQSTENFNNKHISSFKATDDSYKTATSLYGLPKTTEGWKPCCKLVPQTEKDEKPFRRELKGVNTMRKYDRDPINEGDAKNIFSQATPKGEFVNPKFIPGFN